MNIVVGRSGIELQIPLVMEPRGLREIVQIVFHATIDALILLFYLIEHLIHRLTHSRSEEEVVFRGEVLYHTHNFSKFSDLWSYVKLRRHPHRIPQPDMENFAAGYGFSTRGEREIWTKPHTKGMCMGGVALFCKKWLERGDILETAAAFEGGVPIEGALYQKIYNSLLHNVYCPDIVAEVNRIIRANPENFNERLEIWRREQDFGDLTPGEVKASFRKAIADYTGVDLAERDRTLAILDYAQLKSEIVHFNASPEALLRTIGTLQPGTYKLSLPCYNSVGKNIGYHAIAFVVQSSGFSYFYDPNSCIACSSREEVQATIGRLFTAYTGFDYSRNLAGESPSLLKKMKNFFQDEANPPSTLLTNSFDLFHITRGETL